MPFHRDSLQAADSEEYDKKKIQKDLRWSRWMHWKNLQNQFSTIERSVVEISPSFLLFIQDWNVPYEHHRSNGKHYRSIWKPKTNSYPSLSFDETLNKIEPNDFSDDGIIHLDSEVRVLQPETNAFAYEQWRLKEKDLSLARLTNSHDFLIGICKTSER